MRLLLALLLLSFEAGAATWYVRPASGEYGAEDGTSYATAFDGFADVAWGVGNVTTGDTLVVCGSFSTDSADGTSGAMLLIEAAGVIVDGDCSSQNDLSKAVLDGAGTQDNGIYCVTNALCSGTVIRNFLVQNFDIRGVYVRNDLSTTLANNVTISNVDCANVVGLIANIPQCFAVFGSGTTMSDVTADTVTDDAIHVEGDDLLLTDWRVVAPAYNAATDVGDCVQVATQADNTRIRNGYCDHTNAATKQCVIIQGDAGDDNAEISDVDCFYPETGNATNQTKPLYSSIANTIFKGNYVVGGYYGIWAVGPSAVITGNILRGQELRGIDAVSTVTSGTHLITNNTVSDVPTCISLNGGASVTINIYNNSVNNCTTGIAKGGSATIAHGTNAGYSNATAVNGCCSPLAVTTDPALLGGTSPTTAEGFRPNCATTPLKDAGTYVGQIQDYTGRFFVQPVDIGAFACQGGTYRPGATARASKSARAAKSARASASARP